MKEKSIDAEKLWNVAWTYIRTVVDTVREPFMVLDDKLVVLSANKTFYNVFKVTDKETVGKKVYKLGNGQWNIAKLKILLEDILPKNTFFEDFRVEHVFPRIGRRIIILNARRVFTSKESESEQIILLAMEDITRQIQLEDQLKEYTKNLNSEIAKRTAELESRVHELERMNKFMISRELKMVELKAELAKFKKKNK